LWDGQRRNEKEGVTQRKNGILLEGQKTAHGRKWGPPRASKRRGKENPLEHEFSEKQIVQSKEKSSSHVEPIHITANAVPSEHERNSKAK